MATSRRIASALGIALALAAARPAEAACTVVMAGRGQTISVGLRGSPGLSFRVDWGDGSAEADQRALGRVRARAHATHEYAAPGRYRVRVDAVALGPGAPPGCSAEAELEIPYDGDPDELAREILAPMTPDELADDGEAAAPGAPSQAPGEADRERVVRTAEDVDDREGLLPAIGRGLRDLLGFFRR